MPVKEHRASNYLKTPEDIATHLNAVIEEFDGDPRLLMKAFRNVAAAQGGVSEIARRADIDRVGPLPRLVGKQRSSAWYGYQDRLCLRSEASVCGVRPK